MTLIIQLQMKNHKYLIIKWCLTNNYHMILNSLFLLMSPWAGMIAYKTSYNIKQLKIIIYIKSLRLLNLAKEIIIIKI